MECVKELKELQPGSRLAMLADRPWHEMQASRNSMRDGHTDESVRHDPQILQAAQRPLHSKRGLMQGL